MWNDRRKLLLAAGLLAFIGAGVVFWIPIKKNTGPTSDSPTVELPRQELELRDGRLHLKSGGGPFTGVMFETAVGGRRMTEVPVKEGRVHGVARGWHDNGQVEVEETFENGVSDGVRTRWYANGKKRNTATIIGGILHGPYTEWHENGQLATQMTLVNGKGEGICEKWLPDGRLKGRITLKEGQPVETNFLASGAHAESAATP